MPKLKLPKEPTYTGPAAIWKRALAFAIDMVILDIVIGSPFRKFFTSNLPQAGFTETLDYLTANPEAATAISAATGFIGILSLLYFAILESRLGQTVGKMLMKIKVHSDSGKIGFMAAAARSMYFIFIFPFILLWVLDPLFLIFTKENRRLSEIISKTKTVEVYTLR
ncbi:RDD family protein [Candidatus Woesearchaeota archaeon]|nr:RDD family protein [Candidatus Woesearchaeota archaeon]